MVTTGAPPSSPGGRGFQAAAKKNAKRNRSTQRPVHCRARRDAFVKKKSSQENRQ
ncbi:hypothetical protein BRPE64_ACDS07910 [Caballeronia insecticola]|uniref:Uncharacterized protein n=1 Tax=Caballeronia insecticola TaxID=758793 RepID=R4WNS5_9BURK|nr:hypothetical protein BRPE64_ACDS07910 [Caballeronia insecticola]